MSVLNQQICRNTHACVRIRPLILPTDTESDTCSSFNGIGKSVTDTFSTFPSFLLVPQLHRGLTFQRM